MQQILTPFVPIFCPKKYNFLHVVICGYLATYREENSCEEKLRFLVHTAGCQAERKRERVYREVGTLLSIAPIQATKSDSCDTIQHRYCKLAKVTLVALKWVQSQWKLQTNIGLSQCRQLLTELTMKTHLHTKIMHEPNIKLKTVEFL